jgi:hypothetical protein
MEEIMQVSLKCGVSAIALVTAVSFAHAQTNERQGGERGAAEHMQGERGGSAQHQGSPTTERRAAQGTAGKQQPGANINERSAQTGRQNPQEENRAQNQQTPAHRTAKAGQNAGQAEGSQPGENTRREGGRSAQENRQRESNAGGAARSGNAGVTENERSKAGRVNFHVSAPQRTELHDVVIHDSAIHVYHRGDVRFAVEVGERIPDTIEFYNPPPRFVEIDPEFRLYKIVVLDDEILVIDPATREIVDVIPA